MKMKNRNFLLKAWDFAASLATHPVKTVRNVAAGITEEPTFTTHKVASTLSLTFGAVALGVGALNMDPLLIGTGFVFAGLGGNALAAKGEAVRTQAQSDKAVKDDAVQSNQAEDKVVEDVVIEDGPKELSIKDKAAILVPEALEQKSGFKPDLSKFRRDDGPTHGL
jgi:hypothetical protein